MQAQRDLYVAGLPEKITALEAALSRFSSTGDEDAAFSALAQAHKLAGSGGTFGFPGVSEAAADLEKILSAATASPHPLDKAALQSLEASLQSLKASVAQSIQHSTSAPLSAPAPSADPAGEEGAALPRGKPTRRVYIVEPDPAAADALAGQLRHSGYESTWFGQPAPAPAAQERPAAILANIAFSAERLPALRTMAAPTPTVGIPVIFISGGSDFQARLLAVRAGGAGYFPQPLDVRALVTLLDRVTSGEPSRPDRVLIVEDDESLAAFYAGVLASAGIETRIVSDPTLVMASLVDFQPDMITCDIYMPHCNGIELAALIRQQPEFVRIPIVFLSAETSLDKQSLALKQGGDDFIMKPVEPAALISAAQSRARRYRSLLAAEDTLRISEERFRLVFETSLDGFIQSLADGTVISVNPAACNMFRMSEQQIRAAGIPGLVDAADPRIAAVLRHTRSGKFRGELSCVRGDGTRFPVEVSSSQHVSSIGDVQVSVILRDITERQLAERQIMQLNAELETRVEKRTAELTAANQELQAFSHALAHDLRQPYIAINGMASLLEKEVGATITERGKHYLHRIRSGISQMNERTDSLLALAQLSRAQTRRGPVDLAALARQTLGALQKQDPGRSVRTRVQEPLLAQADAALMQHLLHILLGNAWKFTSEQADADISIAAEPASNGEMVFSVKDNGAGFDMAYADKLFRAFQRLHASGEFAGAGIGLATARRIVTRHGGRIWATSAPGKGASFYFTLGQAAG